jgi:predicted phosphodiesterase
MKIHVLSDLHLDVGPVELPETDADVVVIAGDVHPKLGGLKWIKETFPKQPVIYVAGNHEYYGKSIPYLTEKFRAEATGTNVHFLENQSAVINGVCFLGCTLWTDFDLFGSSGLSRVLAREQMNDYRRVRLSTHQFRKLRPADTAGFHYKSRNWLRREFSDDASCNKPVIVSHHAPSIVSLPLDRRVDELCPAYASHLDNLVGESGAALWAHGHIHSSSDYTIGTTRVVCNPRGYPDCPNEQFDPGLIVEI